MEEKEFGKLSRQQIREYFAVYHLAGLQKSEYVERVNANKAFVNECLAEVGSWGWLYNFSMAATFKMLMEAMGLQVRFDTQVLQASDPHQAFLAFMDRTDDLPDLSDEALPLVLALYQVALGNIEGLSAYGLSIGEMVQRVADGEDDPLFMAVRCDRLALEAKPIAARIARAQVFGDESFMNRLAKAITLTKPVRPKPELDDSRVILRYLEDAIGLHTLANKTIDELVADDLQALPGSNSFDRLSKQLTAFRNLFRK